MTFLHYMSIHYIINVAHVTHMHWLKLHSFRFATDCCGFVERTNDPRHPGLLTMQWRRTVAAGTLHWKLEDRRWHCGEDARTPDLRRVVGKRNWGPRGVVSEKLKFMSKYVHFSMFLDSVHDFSRCSCSCKTHIITRLKLVKELVYHQWENGAILSSSYCMLLTRLDVNSSDFYTVSNRCIPSITATAVMRVIKVKWRIIHGSSSLSLSLSFSLLAVDFSSSLAITSGRRVAAAYTLTTVGYAILAPK